MQGFIDSSISLLTLLVEVSLVIALIPVVIYVVWRVISKVIYNQELESKAKGNENVFLKIKIPPSNDQKEDAMEAFLKSIHRLISNGTYLSLEMVSSDQFMTFYIVVPHVYKSLIESQIYAQFSDAELETTTDYASGINASVISELGFKRSSAFPLKTYKNLDEDLLKNLSAVLSKTSSGEKVAIQINLKRVGSKFWQRGLTAVLFEIFNRSSSGENKLSSDLFLGKVRIAYSAPERTIAVTKLSTISSLFKALKSSGNELQKTRGGANLIQAFTARIFEDGDLWSIPEIATIYHFPYKGSIVSNVVNTTSKRAPAPDILPREGRVAEDQISVFGETNYRNEGKRFGIKRIDRRRHMYVVGKTGSGKSRLLQLMLMSDIKSDKGCCILDPHGDLAEEILTYVPRKRIKDVVYVNPTDRDFPIGFNPLEPVEDYETRQHLSVFFISIFKKLFAATWNPRMEHLIRYITLALLETKDSNILGIPRILSDTTFRQQVVMQIKDPVVKSFWTNEFSGYNERFSNEAVIPILNKVGQFIANPVIRNMIGQKNNALDFEKFMNEGKIVILNLSKGKLGEENTALLGSMFITKIQQAALARAKVREEERRDFYFYVDEFQNFATDAFSSILSEARKYHLDLTIAHQYIAQLPDDVKATAFGNVGTIISFAVGGDDAAYLSKEFSPTFTADDLINLNSREMYIKMSIDGRLTTPFSAKTVNIEKSKTDYSIEIIDNSRVKYGKNRVAVENEINRWTSGRVMNLSNSSDEELPEPII